ncbi:outer membrane protein [Shinella zoogloeoides]
MLILGRKMNRVRIYRGVAMKCLPLLGAFFPLLMSDALADDAALQASQASVRSSARYDWSGFYIGLNAGYSRSKAATRNDDASFDPNNHEYFIYDPRGAGIGAYAGYNFQFSNNIVAGVEVNGTYSFADSDNVPHRTNSGSVDPNFVGYSKLKNQGSALVRMGYAFDAFLPYVTAGVALSNFEDGWTHIAGNTYSKSQTRVGWAAGLGVEYGLSPNWVMRADYLYADYGKTRDLNFSDDQGNSWYAGTKDSLTVGTIKLGVAYKF